MKKIISALLVTLISSSVLAFQNGLYRCVEGNETSICPQRVAVRTSYGIKRLVIYYSGDCNDQGPYSYECSDDSNCGDGIIQFTKKTETSYIWQNKPHGFFCRFEKQTN